MAASWSSLLSNEAIIQMVGHEAFARGVVYARGGHVHDVNVDAESLVVSGRVTGSYREAYSTSVRLAGGGPRQLPLDDYDTLNVRQLGSRTSAAHQGYCSCPVTLDCKHAAALLVVARSVAEISRALDRPGWEKTLSRLLSATEAAGTTPMMPLALEFEVERIPGYRGASGKTDLRIRPVQRGKSGKWIRTGISWDELDHPAPSHRPEQRDLLLQIRSAAGAPARYSYPKSPWLSLHIVTGGIWPLLRAAAQVELALVGPGSAGRGPDILPGRATVALDVRRPTNQGLVVRPLVLLDGEPLEIPSIGLLGEPAHGLFAYPQVGRREPQPDLTLIQFERPLSRDLRALVLDREPMHIPAADETRFVEDYVPQLRQRATLTSTDGSVRLPKAVAPELTVDVHFRPEHRLRLDWGWAYRRDSTVLTFGLGDAPERTGVRDLAAERVILAELSLPYDRLPQLAETAGVNRPAAHVLLADTAAALFVDEVMPGLAAAGVQVTVHGDVVDYRRVDTPPLVAVATTEDDQTSDWFDLRIEVSVDGEVLPFDQLFVALTAEQQFLILDTGVYVPLDRPEFDQLRALINEARALDDHERPGLRISKFQASLWDELVQLGVIIEQSDRWATMVRGLNNITEIEPVDVPQLLQAQLRPYQLEGFRWLTFLYRHGLGGVLADDMGLGKTLQALAMICLARTEALTAGAEAPRPFLVVAPTSVVASWSQEVRKFAPDLTVVAVDETESKRGIPWARAMASADLVVTSYTLLRIDFDTYDSVAWSGMILDEAQFVKNHRSKTYVCARRLKAPFKLAITGTPLENSLMDLWALLSITAPGLFSSPERFSELYRRPIERGQNTELLSQLRRRIRPLMLRRTKDKVASELPPKQEQVLSVVLQPRHQRIYQTHLQRERQKVLGLIDDLDTNRFTILRSLTLLRQLALDPSLVDEAHAGIPASKIDVLCEHLHELVREGHRALVFSQFTSFLTKIRTRLDADGIDYAYLDGRTRAREKVVSDFKNGGAPVFLISLKAGGFGLNLTEADYCFVLDPWWNPAAEAQAVDRTHRIGQTKSVMVYRLVAADTIEEKVMQLKARKETLFDSVLGDDALASAALSADEIRGLFGV
jgi:superfamily II DNA or RNA helicase